MFGSTALLLQLRVKFPRRRWYGWKLTFCGMIYSIHDGMSLLEFKSKWTYKLIHPCRCIVVVGFQTDCQVASGGTVKPTTLPRTRRIIRWGVRRDWQPHKPIGELYALVTLANPRDGADSGTSHDFIRDDEGRWACTAADLSSVVTQICHGNSRYHSSKNSGGVASRFTRLCY